MIIAIGIDMAKISRIEKMLSRYNGRFTHRIFTSTERQKADAQRHRAASYAKRWAAKEACAKALGTGMQKGVNWASIGVDNDHLGKPFLRLQGASAERLQEITPEGHQSSLHLSLSDDGKYAQALVIVEAQTIG